MSSSGEKAFSIKQSKRKDPDSEKYWLWSMWIDGAKNVLEQINNVEYILHPTYRNRVRNISSSKTKFKLSEKGMGEFTVYVRVFFKDKERKPKYLSHDLVLSENSNLEKQRVFISSQLKNESDKDSLSRILEGKDYVVSTIENIKSNSNISESIVDSIDESDVMIVMGDEMTKWQEYEIMHAIDMDKEVYILNGETGMKNEAIIHVNSKEDLIEHLESSKKHLLG